MKCARLRGKLMGKGTERRIVSSERGSIYGELKNTYGKKRGVNESTKKVNGSNWLGCREKQRKSEGAEKGSVFLNESKKSFEGRSAWEKTKGSTGKGKSVFKGGAVHSTEVKTVIAYKWGEAIASVITANGGDRKAFYNLIVNPKKGSAERRESRELVWKCRLFNLLGGEERQEKGFTRGETGLHQGG